MATPEKLTAMKPTNIQMPAAACNSRWKRRPVAVRRTRKAYFHWPRLGHHNTMPVRPSNTMPTPSQPTTGWPNSRPSCKLP